jgi:hypothetical protein
VVALATSRADNSRDTDGAEVRDYKSWLHPHLDRCRPEHVSTADDEPALPAHVDLPALNVEVVRAVNLEYNCPHIADLPLGVDVAQPAVRVEALDLAIWLLNAKPPTDSYQVDFAQGLSATANVTNCFTKVRFVPYASDMLHGPIELFGSTQPLLHHGRD